MRMLLTLLPLVAGSGLTTQAFADAPVLSPSPLVAPSEGLVQTRDAQLTCAACVAVESTGIATFALSYLGGVGVWLASEREITNSSSGSWAGGVLVPMFQVADLGGLVPVVGPSLEALFVFSPGSLQQKLAWIDAGAQAAGMTLALVGAFAQTQWERSHHLAVVPLVRPGVSGMAVGGTF